MTAYWLAEWLDSEGIADPDVIRGVLQTPTGFERMIETANASPSTPPLTGLSRSLVTGTGMDLSGVMSCGNPSCLMETVDDLIRRSWHYFDHVIVSGLDPHDFLRSLEDMDQGHAIDLLVNHAQVALYIRDIGAEDYFAFRRKHFFCTKHLDQHAQEAGMPPASQMFERLSQILTADCILNISEHNGELIYTYEHPALDTVTHGPVFESDDRNKLAEEVAKHHAGMLISGLTRSVAQAREANAPLGQAALLDSNLIPVPPPTGDVVQDVALNLSLPTVKGVAPAELLAFRKNEGDEFEVFRAALAKTIEERIRALPDQNVDSISRAVVDDVLTPAMKGLDRRMRRSTQLLGKRSAAVVATSGVLTTVGLLAFAPLTLPGLILGAGGLVANYNDYLKDQRDIEISDLHFLWRAGSDKHA